MNQEEQIGDSEPLSEQQPPRKGNRFSEEFLGRVIVSLVVFSLAAGLVFVGVFSFRAVKDRPSERVSIGTLPSAADVVTEMPEAKTEPEAPKEPEQPVVPKTTQLDPKSIQVSVLNAGAAKGSAGVLAETLKKAGYEKASGGNAAADFSGITVFFKDGFDEAAKATLEIVKKSYPKAVSAQADPSKPDSIVSQVTVILGK